MNVKNTSISLFLLASIGLSGCQSVEPVEIPVVPKSTSHQLPAGHIGDNVVSRVGTTTMLVPGSAALTPAVKSNFLQAFTDMGFETQLTTNGFLVFLPTGSHFDLNKANIKPELATLLKKIVNEANKTYLSSHHIQVAGHTDSIGSSKANQELSNRRAAAVKRELITLGTNSNRVSSIGYGESKPRYSEATKSKYNRRTDLLFINP